jgi:phage-related minor tail protein
MADDARIVLSAVDNTSAAFQSAARNLAGFQRQAGTVNQTLSKIGVSSGQTAAAMKQLPAQLQDLFIQLQGGQSPLTALLQQGSQVSSSFGGLGNAFKAIASTITPARIAFGGAAAALALLGKAALDGHNEAKALADALTLTGNAAGLTAGSFDKMARSIAAISGRSVGNVKEFGLALAQTGQIGPQAFESATAAAERFGEATGQSAEEVAKSFAKIAENPKAAAAELVRAYGLLNLAQLENIRSLQEQGRTGDAAKVVFDALGTRLQSLDSNLGLIERALKAGKGAWSDFWNAAKGLGVPETVESQLSKLQQSIAATQKAQETASERGDTERLARLQNRMAGLKQQEGVLATQQFGEEIQAALDAIKTQNSKDQAAASEFVDGMHKRTYAVGELQKKIAEANRQIDTFNKAAREQGLPEVSQAERSREIERITKEMTDPRIAAGAQANLDAALKAIERRLDQAKDKFADANARLQSVFSSGNLSLSNYFEQRRSLIVQQGEAEAQALEARAAAERNALRSTPALEPAEIKRRQTEIADLTIKAAEARRKAASEASLTLLEQAQATKQLQEQLREFDAQILQLQGRDFDAAQLRLQTTIDRARELQRKAAEPTTGDFSREDRGQESSIQALERLTTAQNKFNALQTESSRIATLASNAEEIYAIQARERGDGLVESEAKVREIRQQQLDVLGQMVARTQALADATKSPEMLLALSNLQVQYERLKESVDPTKLRFDSAADNIGDAIANGLARATTEAGNLKSILSDTAKQVFSLVNQELFVKPLASQISGFIKGSGGQGAGENLISFFGKKLGSFGSSQSSATGAGFGDDDRSARAAAEALGGVSESASGVSGILGKLFGAASSVSDVFGRLPSLAAIPATTALNALAAAAQTATAALAQVSASSGGGSGLGSLLGLLGSGGGGKGPILVPEARGAFDGGGYTGHGGRLEVAGTVHRGEYVFDAPVVRAIGVGALDRMRAAVKSGIRGYADGGYVGVPPSIAGQDRQGNQGAQRGPATVVNVTNQIGSGVSRGEVESLMQRWGTAMQANILRSIKTGGAYSG